MFSRSFTFSLSLLALFFVFFYSCSWLEVRQRAKYCQFRIQQVSLGRYSLSSPRYVYLKVTVGVKNPNPAKAVLDPFEWRYYANGQLIAKGSYSQSVVIPPKGENSFVLEIQVDLWQLSKTLVQAILTGSAKYHMEATVFVNTPFGTLRHEVKIREGKWNLWGDDDARGR